MFDAIAPRYDLVNRMMTFRLDVRWRRLAVRVAGAAARLGGARPGLRHRRPVRRAGPAGTCADLGRPVASGCSPPTAAARPGCRPTSCACRCPTAALDGVTCGFALRNLVELGGVLRRARPRRAPGRADRAARRRHAAQPGPAVGPRHLLRQGRAPDRRAAVRPARLPVPAPSVAYLPPPAEMLGALRAAGLRRRVQRALLSGGITQLSRRRGRDAHAGRHPTARAATSTSTASPAATASCSCATASASPAGAWRRACRSADVAGVLAAIERDDDGRAARLRPVAFGVLPFLPGATGRARHPGRRRRQGRRTATGGSRRSTAPTADARDADRAAPPPARGGVHASRPASTGRALPRRRRGRRATRSAPGGSTKVVHRPRRARSRPTGRSTSTPSCSGCGPRSARATATRSTASSAPPPSCWSPADGDVVRSHPLAGTAPRTGDPTTDARARGRAASPRRRTRSSTAS